MLQVTNYRGKLAWPLFPVLDRQENEYRGPTTAKSSVLESGGAIARKTPTRPRRDARNRQGVNSFLW